LRRLLVIIEKSPSVKWFFIAVLTTGFIFLTSSAQANIGKLSDYTQKGQLNLSNIKSGRPENDKIIYEVKNGDILISILKRYGVSEGDALTATKKIDRRILKKIKPSGELELNYSKDRTAIIEIGYTFKNEKRKVLYSGKGLPVAAVKQTLITKYNQKVTAGLSMNAKKTSVIESFKPRPVGWEQGRSERMLSTRKGQKPDSIQTKTDIFMKDTVPGPAELISADLEFIPGMVPWEISDKSYSDGHNNSSIFNAPQSLKNRFRNLMVRERLMLLRAKLAAKREFLKAPLAYKKITSKFAWRVNPITGNPEHHTGVDYAASYGTPVKSIGYGKVIFTGWRNGYGETVQIRHHDGYISQYAHLSRFGKEITEGKAVKRGEIIGYVGSSGMSTGPHLDLRVMKSGAYVNPLTLNKTLKHENSKKYSSHKLRKKSRYLTNAKHRSKTTVASRR
jgi:murein DD-endopeptidase MepM/ murein hydrolase activator NlpD